MTTIEERLQNVRTIEDIVYLLSILFTNLNNQNKMYYDMFLNPTPMDINLERYDENGELGVITLPNRAKDRIWVLTGKGNPNGQVAAKMGTVYLDETSKNLWFKSDGSDSSTSGWKQIYDSSYEFLRPDGNGSRLTNLNANSITDGILDVIYGGTGTGYITDGYLVQGHGINRFTPFNLSDISSILNEFVGMIMWCPMSNITGRWLVCDGKAYSREGDYNSLFLKIGTKYGSGDGSTTFNVPNLLGGHNYIKASSVANVGSTGEGSVKSHSHGLSGYTGNESSHTHGKGSFRIQGYIGTCTGSGGAPTPPFYTDGKAGKNQDQDGQPDPKVYMDTDRGGWSGSTGAGSPHNHPLVGSTQSAGSSTNEVNHINLVPVIRY